MLRHSGLVSVVIPSRDRPNQVIDACRSVLAQTYKKCQVIVVFNNSRKDSVSKIEEFVYQNNLEPRVKIFDIGFVDNANLARNYGYDASDSEYVAFLDSDDIYLEQHLEEAVRILSSSPELGMVYGSFLINNGEMRTECIASHPEVSHNGCPFEYILGKRSAWAITSTMVVRKTVIDSLKWDSKLSRHQDFDYFLRVYKNHKVGVDPKCTVIVNWVRGEKRDINFKGLFNFYGKWEKEIPHKVKNQYLWKMLEFSASEKKVDGVLFYSSALFRNLLKF